MRERFDAEKIKGAVGVEDFARVLEALGATVNRRTGRSTCPAHGGENREALHYNEKNGVILWTCFTGCGIKGGDVLSLVQKARACTFAEALEWTANELGLSPEPTRKGAGLRPQSPSTPPATKGRPTPSPSAPAASTAPTGLEETRSARLARLWDAFATKDEKAEAYLRRRGIAARPELVRFNVGKTGDEEADRLAAEGFRIAVPLYAPSDGRLVSMQFRRADDAGDLKRKNLAGALDGAVFGLPGGLASIGEKDVLLVAEGLTDYLAAVTAGEIGPADGAYRVRVIGFPGAGGSLKMPATFGDALKGREVLLALDRDSTGESAARELARELLRAGAKPYRVRTVTKDLSEDLSRVRDRLASLVYLVNAAAGAGVFDPDARDASEEALRDLEEWRKTLTKTGTSTGFPNVDNILGGGWRERRLYVLAGQTGEGKSAFALRAAHAAAEAGVPVLVVQYEVEAVETRARLVGPLSGTFYGKILSPDTLEAGKPDEIAAAWRDYFSTGPGSRIFVSVPSVSESSGEGPRSGSIAWVKGEAERIARAFDRPPLVIVDYLQPAATLSEDYEGDAGSLRLAVGKTSLGLRDLSRSLGCPVLVLSSIPRTAYLTARNEYRLPELGDLKESGDIEFNADSVLYLWPEREDWREHEGQHEDRDSVASRPMLFRAVKGRQSGTGSALLTWNPPMGTFADAGKPQRKERPKKGSEKKNLDRDALAELIVKHGKGTGSGGAFEIEAERAEAIAAADFGAKPKDVRGVVAKFSRDFEKKNVDGAPVLVFHGKAEA